MGSIGFFILFQVVIEIYRFDENWHVSCKTTTKAVPTNKAMQWA
jgi:hypothetical protein